MFFSIYYLLYGYLFITVYIFVSSKVLTIQRFNFTQFTIVIRSSPVGYNLGEHVVIIVVVIWAYLVCHNLMERWMSHRQNFCPSRELGHAVVKPFVISSVILQLVPYLTVPDTACLLGRYDHSVMFGFGSTSLYVSYSVLVSVSVQEGVTV